LSFLTPDAEGRLDLIIVIERSAHHRANPWETVECDRGSIMHCMPRDAKGEFAAESRT
jgi:hypothetical protein